MSKRQWTPQQQECIDARGSAILVSAAAGSGKTAVLIARILGLLTDADHPTDIDRLLVVTFTKAAAAEMRVRLSAALSDLLAHDPHNRRLLRQQMLLPQAAICTVDSFCTQLLREYAQEAGVSPRFCIAEGAALTLLRRDTAAAVIEQAYRRADPAFLQLCDLLAADKDDKALQEQLLRLYQFIQAHPFPMVWLEEQQAQFQLTGSIRDSVWGQLLIEQAKEWIDYARIPLARACALALEDERTADAYYPAFLQLGGDLDAAAAALDGNWDTAVSIIGGIAFSPLKALRNFEDEVFKKRLQELWSDSKERVKKLQSLFTRTEARAQDDVAQSAPLVSALFDLVRAFDTAFTAAKAEQNQLDFNDLEHKALSLLAVPQEDGFCRTAAAKEIGGRYDYIMVDEYQDTNATQDTLFSSLSDEERNLFFVGDIKQSIYGFRQAMPSIFQGRRERAAADGDGGSTAITLGHNFRSRAQVASTVNYLFSRLMTAQTGALVYDEREALVPAAAFPDAYSERYDSELLVIERDDKDELSGDEAEAYAIGRRILQMIADGFPVTDGDAQRPAAFRDFCILLRSTSHHAAAYAKVFQALGIPLASGSGDPFFRCAEISLTLSFFKAIDNPLLDVPLLAVMMSPLYGFSPDEVATVRAASPKTSLFVALRKSAGDSDRLGQKVQSFLHMLDRYRMLAAAMPADALMRRIFEDTALPTVLSARRGGAQRLANLRRLYDYARRFEQQDFRGLSAFIRYMDRLEQHGIEPEASAHATNRNAVQLMTVHHSKGLEFPIVFVAGLGVKFNDRSASGDVLLHAEYGVGLVRRDRETLVQSSTVHKDAIAYAILRSEHSEELRVLYVAATRAKDKLFFVCAVSGSERRLTQLSAAVNDDGTLKAAAVLRAGSMSDWVLAAMLSHPASSPLRARLGGISVPICESDPYAAGLRVTVEAANSSPTAVCQSDDAQPQRVRLEGVAERLRYEYPYAALGHIPSKMTASETAHKETFSDAPLSRPAFLSPLRLTPAQRGTAVHSFLEHMQPGGAPAAVQAQSLVDRGILNEKQQNSLPLAALQDFLDSPLAARMKRSPMLLREFPFAIDRPLTELPFSLDGLPEDAKAESVMVQGIADCVFEEDGALVIVDYKTDRVQRGDELAARYRSQLLIYREALARALQRPVKQCLLYSFSLGCEVGIL